MSNYEDLEYNRLTREIHEKGYTWEKRGEEMGKHPKGLGTRVRNLFRLLNSILKPMNFEITFKKKE